MQNRHIGRHAVAGLTIGTLALLFFTMAPPSAAAQSNSELAKQSQNPIANLSSLPIQMNITPNSGSDDGTLWVTNIQPVLPKNLGKWNLINRFILPVIDQPRQGASIPRERGLGDLTYQGFFSPAAASETTWGIGPQLVVPTGTDDLLGTEKWSLGPAFVMLKMPGQWVVGGVISNIWSFAGDDNRADVNFFLLQPFINYNFDKGWYLTTAPIITANWEADSNQRWTIPIGGGFGRVFRWGKQAVNANTQIYYNIDHPDNIGDWAFRVQLQFLFPKKPK